MKPGDFHVVTEIFPAGFTKPADTAAFPGPDNVSLACLIPDHHFMAEHPWEDKIPVPLFPHFGIGPADSATQDAGVCKALFKGLRGFMGGHNFKLSKAG
jgi:hypothetical protein